MQINSIRIRLIQGDAIVEYIEGSGEYNYQSVSLSELTDLIQDLITIGAGVGSLNFQYNETSEEITIDKSGLPPGHTLLFTLNGEPFDEVTQQLAPGAENFFDGASIAIYDEGVEVASPSFKLTKLGGGTLALDYDISVLGAGIIGAINSTTIGGMWRATLTALNLNGGDSVVKVEAIFP